jgi:hypothetical protein
MSVRSKHQYLVASNRKLAKQIWGALDPLQVRSLGEISRFFGFSIAMRDILLLQTGWYVTHAGLLRLAKRRHCAGIDAEPVREFCDPIAARWTFKATVYKTRSSRGFVGHGDANPSNVSSLVLGSEMRVAETRAVNRALRKAYGIGLCSIEELGWSPRTSDADRSNQNAPTANGNHGHQNGQRRLRDQLCLPIRQHDLDPMLVKKFAADFCGTQTLKEASHNLVESFIAELAAFAKKDRAGLICKLNSYARPVEATP